LYFYTAASRGMHFPHKWYFPVRQGSEPRNHQRAFPASPRDAVSQQLTFFSFTASLPGTGRSPEKPRRGLSCSAGRSFAATHLLFLHNISGPGPGAQPRKAPQGPLLQRETQFRNNSPSFPSQHLWPGARGAAPKSPAGASPAARDAVSQQLTNFY